jgi:hypothetical protein
MTDLVLERVRSDFEMESNPWYGDILADLFSVARCDESGRDRKIGYYSFGQQWASLWFIQARADIVVTAHYNVTCFPSCRINTYIIHPLPNLRETIYDRTIYPPDSVWFDGHEVGSGRLTGWTLYAYADNWEYSEFV